MNTYNIENRTLVVIDGELYEKMLPIGGILTPSPRAMVNISKPAKEKVFNIDQPKRGFTDAEKENIYELTRRGEKPKAISKIFKCNPAKISMVLMFARKNGVNLEPNQDQPSFEE